MVALHRPLAEPAGQPRHSARRTSRSSRSETSSPQPGSSTGSLRPISPRGARRARPALRGRRGPPSSQARLTVTGRAALHRRRQPSDRSGSEGGARWTRVAPPACRAGAAGARRRLRRGRRPPRRRSPRPRASASGTRGGAPPARELSERISQPRVDDESPGIHASSDLGVVDDLAVVVLGRSCRLERFEHLRVVGGGRPSMCFQPCPGVSPCARTARVNAAGSGRPRSGTSPGAARTGCRPARDFPA